MKRRNIHEASEFFEYVRLGDGSVPAADPKKIDVAVLDMNHSWPNIGHDAIIHAIQDATEEHQERLRTTGKILRVLSYDVRRRLMLPEVPNGRFLLYVGTGGPGHLDPRQNDGMEPWSQGIRETAEWEAPLFNLFDRVLAKEEAALIAVCHSFGLVCRWTGVARPQQREEKSTGMPTNVLSEEATAHPWFSRFSAQLPDRRHYRVIDNRLFDLVLESPGKSRPLAFESDDSSTVTMVEIERERESGMPRVFGANHHPEIIDRDKVMAVLDAKRAHGEVSELWYREREHLMTDLFRGESERQSRITSEFTFLGLLRHHVGRLANR
ncbi:MAG: hypothetical protein JJE51_09300 [Thermoanaerobaculia bacterium]|nr:hypothetical protein [Thermoanaerobaculia bacterium]